MLVSCVQRETGMAITATDDGRTVSAPTGALIRLSLSASVAWEIQSNDPEQLRLVETSVVSSGRDATRVWIFKATAAGEVPLRAIPMCVATASECPDHPLRFVIDVHD